ncbi:MAG TPA: hypothetical protein VJT73_15565 [Polyangiaceae bacterium]|nr:hypothetical protein [Polyangiaceae bacterium]
MPKMRSGHLVIGVCLMVMGFAVMIIASARQSERASANASVPACVGGPEVVHAAPPPTPAPSPAPTVAAMPAPPAAASAAPADAEGEGANESRLFKFNPGGATMTREEVVRLLALGKAVARKPAARVLVEGFGDLPGSDPLMMGIAKHRAKVAQTLLGKAGVTEERVTVSFSDMGTDTRLARTIRIVTTPPLSEVEKP